MTARTGQSRARRRRKALLLLAGGFLLLTVAVGIAGVAGVTGDQASSQWGLLGQSLGMAGLFLLLIPVERPRAKLAVATILALAAGMLAFSSVLERDAVLRAVRMILAVAMGSMGVFAILSIWRPQVLAVSTRHNGPERSAETTRRIAWALAGVAVALTLFVAILVWAAFTARLGGEAG